MLLAALPLQDPRTPAYSPAWRAGFVCIVLPSVMSGPSSGTAPPRAAPRPPQVMYDASGVRLHAGKQASVLNMIITELPPDHPVSNSAGTLKDTLGHTPLQVCGGVWWGWWRWCVRAWVGGRGGRAGVPACLPARYRLLGCSRAASSDGVVDAAAFQIGWHCCGRVQWRLRLRKHVGALWLPTAGGRGGRGGSAHRLPCCVALPLTAPDPSCLVATVVISNEAGPKLDCVATVRASANLSITHGVELTAGPSCSHSLQAP